jgi:hypothetical protein
MLKDEHCGQAGAGCITAPFGWLCGADQQKVMARLYRAAAKSASKQVCELLLDLMEKAKK